MAQMMKIAPEAPARTPERGGKDLNLDLMRALAAFLVLSVHFFLNNGFYAQEVLGRRMLLMTMMRMGFMTCVPLFLVLSGYLCLKKSLSGRYYLGVVRIVLTYALCSVVCLGVRLWRGESIGLTDAARMFLGYSAAPYAWYIEMYLGLFLLIPFLNLIWRGLSTRRGHLALIATMLALTTVPVAINFRYSIAPDWWMGIYPLLYYFLGAYFATYQPRPRWYWLMLGLAAAVVLGGTMMYVLSLGGVFQWLPLSDWYGPTTVLSTCLLFLLVRQIPVERWPRWAQWLVRKGSELSLGIYLLSWCFDSWLYPILTERVPNMLDRLPFYILIVPAVYLCSALASQGVEWVRRGITLGLDRIFPRLGLK